MTALKVWNKGDYVDHNDLNLNFSILNNFPPGALPLIGGTMTGPIVLSADPAAPLQPATKQYADTKLPLAGGTMTGPIVLPADPTTALQAATKQYADLMLPLTGGTLTGALSAPAGVSGNQVLNFSQFAASVGSNGYQKLPSGLIIQWGNSTTSAGGGVSVSYPIAFPVATLSLQTTVNNGGTTPNVVLAVTGAGATSFGVNSGITTTGAVAASISFYWFAVGR